MLGYMNRIKQFKFQLIRWNIDFGDIDMIKSGGANLPNYFSRVKKWDSGTGRDSTEVPDAKGGINGIKLTFGGKGYRQNPGIATIITDNVM